VGIEGEKSSKWKVTARYVRGLGIDGPLAFEEREQIYYYHADGLDSNTALPDKLFSIQNRPYRFHRGHKAA